MFSCHAHSESCRRIPEELEFALLHEDDKSVCGSARTNSWTPGPSAAATQRECGATTSKRFLNSWSRIVEKFACFQPSTLHDENELELNGDDSVLAGRSASFMVQQIQRERSHTMSSYLVTAPSSLPKSESSRKGRRYSRTNVYGYPEQQTHSDIFL